MPGAWAWDSPNQTGLVPTDLLKLGDERYFLSLSLSLSLEFFLELSFALSLRFSFEFSLEFFLKLSIACYPLNYPLELHPLGTLRDFFRVLI